MIRFRSVVIRCDPLLTDLEPLRLALAGLTPTRLTPTRRAAETSLRLLPSKYDHVRIARADRSVGTIAELTVTVGIKSVGIKSVGSKSVGITVAVVMVVGEHELLRDDDSGVATSGRGLWSTHV